MPKGCPVVVSDASKPRSGARRSARTTRRPSSRYRGGDYVAEVALGPGKWDLRYVATAPDGTTFRQRLELYVR
jgi:nitrogen fixation protein FixH